MSKEKLKNKGITLIALIITIIVMLILTGVTLSITLGDNGIVNNAKLAKEQMQREMDRELLLSAVVGAVGVDGKVDLTKLDNNLPEGFSGDNGTYLAEQSGTTFTVSSDGEITIAEGTTEDSTEKSVLNGTYYDDLSKANYYVFDIENSIATYYYEDEGETYSEQATISEVDEANQTITISISDGEETYETTFKYEFIIKDNNIVNIILFGTDGEGEKDLLAWQNTEGNGNILTGTYYSENNYYRIVFDDELPYIEEQYKNGDEWGYVSGFEPTFYVLEDNIIYIAGRSKCEISDDYNTINMEGRTYTKQAGE